MMLTPKTLMFPGYQILKEYNMLVCIFGKIPDVVPSTYIALFHFWVITRLAMIASSSVKLHCLWYMRCAPAGKYIVGCPMFS